MSAPLSYNVRGAAAATGISESRLKKAIKEGQLKVKKSGTTENGEPAGTRIILHAELVKYLESLVDA